MPASSSSSAIELRKCVVTTVLRDRLVLIVRDLGDQSEHEAVLRGKARKLFFEYGVGREVFAGVRPDGPWVVITETEFKHYPHLVDARARLEDG